MRLCVFLILARSDAAKAIEVAVDEELAIDVPEYVEAASSGSMHLATTLGASKEAENYSASVPTKAVAAMRALIKAFMPADGLTVVLTRMPSDIGWASLSSL